MRRSLRERLVTWVLTGPAGHLYGGVADFGEQLARYLWATRVRPAWRRLRSAP